MARGPLALALALLVAVPARPRASDDPAGGAACVVQTPAPKGSARLRWQSPGESEGAPGFWISDDAMQRTSARMSRCIDGWAICERDLSVEKGKRFVPGWRTWVTSIGVAITVGIAVGRFAR